MARIDLSRTVALDAPEAFARVTDFRRHSDWVPLTTVTLRDPSAPGGGGFVARTAIGPLGFDDVNVLRRIREPGGDRAGVAELDKAGPVVRGWARITVTPTGPSSSEVRWEEEIRVLAVPAWCDPVVAASSRWLFGRLLDGLLPASTGVARRMVG